ncbi:MAG: DUF2799 domain-containing protein [Pseudomonadota bacterium]
MQLRCFVVLGAFAASACTGVSKEECVTADWGAIGYEDGVAGRSVSSVSNWRSVCAKKAGVTVDMAAYRAGRDEGLRHYCRASNGYAVGSRGGGYAGVCPADIEQPFLAAYEAGHHLWSLENAVSSIAGRIRQAQYDLRDVEHRIAETEIALISPGRSATDRVALLAELKYLAEERAGIERKLDALSFDQARAEDDLALYRDELAYDRVGLEAISPTEARY